MIHNPSVNHVNHVTVYFLNMNNDFSHIKHIATNMANKIVYNHVNIVPVQGLNCKHVFDHSCEYWVSRNMKV